MTDARPDTLRRPGIELLCASFVVLFQELALIRWLPVEVRVAAYFPNLILLSAFLGLGVGALRARSRALYWLWPVSLLVIVGAAWGMGKVAFTAEGVTEHLWLLYHDLPESAPVVEGIHGPLVLFFCLGAASFVPLGQYVGRRLEIFRAQGSALWGYALDLGGSLLGVVGFAVVSFAGLEPVFWFLPVVALGAVLLAPPGRSRIAFAAAGVLALVGILATTGTERFSPYYALRADSVLDRNAGIPTVRVSANGSLHQIALDLAYDGDETDSLVLAEGYHLPYRRLGRPIRKALVLGAGTGNDVAVLLDEGAQEVHAVEIDPVILELGRLHHANDPYADPRVVVHNTDARSFLNETDETFDVITFGTLDSMTRLSALSNVRLDNFVYTREALAAARERLSDDGGMILYFLVGEQYIADHLLTMLANVFGRIPDMHRGGYSLFNTIFMAGPAYEGATVPAPADAWYLNDELVEAAAPSDDWPYLYLPQRGVTGFYYSMMALLAGLAVVTVLLGSGQMRRSVLSGKGIDVEMFLYGFAFLLIETKFVTAMNLLWGATWLTSAVVFGSILLTILAGTILMELKPLPWPVAGAGLVLALLVVYALPLDVLLRTSPASRLGLSMLYVGAPILFASLCFAARFKAREAADVAFGWNLLGAVLGGLAEFFSMSVGFSALTLVATAAYLLAFLTARGAPRGPAELPLPDEVPAAGTE